MAQLVKESACNTRDHTSITGLGKTPVFLGFPGSSVSKESACNAGDLGSIPELGRSPGGRHSNILQDSCLENSMDRGVWQAMGSQRVGHD